MYKWNKKYIKNLEIYLNDIESNDIEIVYAKEILKSLTKKEHILEKDTYTIKEDYEEMKNIFPNKDIINKILLKNMLLKENNLKYININSSKKDILLYVRDFFKNTNPSWYKTIEPSLNNNEILKYKYNNENYVIFIEYLNKYFISLSKENNIEDFSTPIHEYLHIYSIIKNPKFFYSLESEFLSILGEMINTYEMKKNNMFIQETIKYDINNFKDIIDTTKDTAVREDVVKNNISENNKTQYLGKEYDIDKKTCNEIYSFDLEYSYSKIISYFIALELFDIYKNDKEKCFYLCDILITENITLKEKLFKNKIILMEHEDNYIKTLKKEYIKYNQ